MKKQYLFLSVFLSAVCLCASAQEIVVGYTELPMETCQGDVRDIMYAKQTPDGPMKARMFDNSDDAVIDYRDRITNMPQYLHDFIDAFVEAGQEVLNGGSNWLSDPSKGTASSSYYYYPLKEMTGTVPFTFPVGSSSEVISQAAQDAFNEIYTEEYDILKSFLPYTFLSLNYDHPEFFWIGNGYNYGASRGFRYSYSPSSGSGTVTYTINLVFILKASGFDIRANGIDTYDFRNEIYLTTGVLQFNSAWKYILSQCSGTRYERLLTAHDWLTHHNCYNYYYLQGYGQSQIGDTPWSAYSAMEGNADRESPVCEGYARAFKVLCKGMGVPCILMSGVVTDENGNTGGHMWNYVQMEDEKWYVVDVTWDDPTVWQYYDQAVTGFESHDWFLLGSESPIGGGLTLIESHPEQWFNTYPSQGTRQWELQQGPQLSPTAYTPGGFKKGDVNGDNEISIADAVSVLNAMAGDEVPGNPDVNGDGAVSIADFVTVLNIMAGE